MVTKEERENAHVITWEEPTIEMTDQESKSESLFDALRDEPNSFINVMRQPMGGKQAMEFVTRVDADKFDWGGLMSFLQQNYGGGEYRVMAYANGKLKGNKLITIANPVNNTALATPQDSVTQSLINQMREMQNQLIAIANEKSTGGNSRKEMLEEMLMYKQLFGSESKSSGGMREMLDMVEGLKQLGVNIGVGGESEDSGWGGLAEKMLPLLGAVLTPQPAPIINTVQANPAPRPAPQQKQPTQNTGKNQMLMFLKMGLAQLVNAAAKNSDPYDYATLVMDNVPQEALKEFFTQPDLTKLEALDSRVSNYSEWFSLLGEHIKYRLGMPSTVAGDYDEELTEDEDGHNIPESEVLQSGG